MKNLIYSISALIMLVSSTLSSAEITPLWNLINDVGAVQDMEMLPGGEEFISLVGQGDNGQIQIRNVADGKLLKSFTTSIFPNAKLVFTPDSTRFILLNGGRGELRSFDDKFSVIQTFYHPDYSLGALYRFIAIDPIRPYAYVTDFRMSVFNYETGEYVKSISDFSNYGYTAISVSDDGKYLAAINEGKAYLKVWDLEKMEIIRNVQLYDDKLQQDWWCNSRDIHFSKHSSDLIYFSGNFPAKEKGIFGLNTYNILNNKSGNPTFDYLGGGKFLLINNGNCAFNYNGSSIEILNLLNNEIKLTKEITLEIPFDNTVINDRKAGIFIGNSNEYMGAIIYDPQTSVGTDYEDFTRITPNPTTSLVTVTHFCEDSLMKYRVNDFEGKLLTESNVENIQDDIKLDFTDHSSGVYFLTINCNGTDRTYKIIKVD